MKKRTRPISLSTIDRMRQVWKEKGNEVSLFEKFVPREYDEWSGWHKFLYEVGRGPGRWVRYLLPPHVRKEREREAQSIVAAAAQKLIETPITDSGLSLRQMERVMSSGLRVKYQDRILFGPRLEPRELDRLINDPDSVRAEFPSTSRPRSN